MVAAVWFCKSCKGEKGVVEKDCVKARTRMRVDQEAQKEKKKKKKVANGKMNSFIHASLPCFAYSLALSPPQTTQIHTHTRQTKTNLEGAKDDDKTKPKKQKQTRRERRVWSLALLVAFLSSSALFCCKSQAKLGGVTHHRRG